MASLWLETGAAVLGGHADVLGSPCETLQLGGGGASARAMRDLNFSSPAFSSPAFSPPAPSLEQLASRSSAMMLHHAWGSSEGGCSTQFENDAAWADWGSPLNASQRSRSACEAHNVGAHHVAPVAVGGATPGAQQEHSRRVGERDSQTAPHASQAAAPLLLLSSQGHAQGRTVATQVEGHAVSSS
jgi:hypothetical protein